MHILYYYFGKFYGRCQKKLGQIDTPIHIAQALLELANPKCDIFYDIGAGKVIYLYPYMNLKGY